MESPLRRSSRVAMRPTITDGIAIEAASRITSVGSSHSTSTTKSTFISALRQDGLTIARAMPAQHWADGDRRVGPAELLGKSGNAPETAVAS